MHLFSSRYHSLRLPRANLWWVPVVHLLFQKGYADLNPVQMVELKNGESFNGHLIDCDTFMNITLREVYQTSAESDRFWKLKEVYIRGSTVCLLSILIWLGLTRARPDQVPSGATGTVGFSERRTAKGARSR